MSKLKKDTQMTLLSRIPVMLLSFLSVVLLTQLLGPEGLGVYTYAYTVLNLLLTLVGIQLEGSLPYFLANKQYENGKVFSTISFLAICAIIVLCIFMSITVFLIPGGETLFIPPGQPVTFFFTFLVIAFVARYFSSLIQSSLRGLFRFKAFNAFMILLQLIPVLVYAVLLLLSFQHGNKLPLTTYFKIILVTETILAITGLCILFFKGGISFDKDTKSYRKEIVRYSFRNLLSVFGHFLNKRLDVWFVQHLKGTFALGQYGLATQVSNFINEAMIPFNQVLLPYLAGSEPGEHKLMVGRIARINLFIAFCAAITLAGTAWFFIPLLFGKQFAQAIPAVQILSIGIIFLSQRLVFSNYFKATNQIRYPINAAWAGVVITVILDILLIPKYGLVGASIASIISYGATSGFLVMHASSILGLSPRDILVLQKSDIKWLLSKSNKSEVI